jgi:hypothetical protein
MGITDRMLRASLYSLTAFAFAQLQAQEASPSDRFRLERHDGAVMIVRDPHGSIRTPDDLPPDVAHQFRSASSIPPTPAKRLAAYVVLDPGDAADSDLTDNIVDPLTLRSVIQNANKIGVAASISFASGLTSIAPSSTLPVITVPIILDGSVASGKIILDGSAVTNGTGLLINSTGSTVQNMTFRKWTSIGLGFGTLAADVTVRRNEFFENRVGLNVNGIRGTIGGDGPADANIAANNTQDGIALIFASEFVIKNNLSGTKDGFTAAPNNSDGLYILGERNRVLQNVLSGNGNAGLSIGEFSVGTVARQNLIGTDSTGRGRLGNNSYGVETFANDDTIANNVICANGWGIHVSWQSDRGLIQGNLIGPNKTLDSLLGNRYGGINTGGFFLKVDSNIVSGNLGTGININSYGGVRVTRNRVGTDPTGTLDWGNTGAGVYIGCDTNIIGGPNPGDGNLLSGNGGGGIEMYGGTTLVFGGPSQPNLVQGNVIQHNRIGTDVTGTVRIPNFTGLFMNGHIDSNFVRDNLISGNQNHGVWTRRFPDAPRRNVFQRNRIGVQADGVSPLPNDSTGVMIDSAANNLWGGTGENEGNTIAHSNQAGIAVKAGWGTQFYRNSIHHNRGSAIDLGNNGPTPNDSADLDLGPHRLQNFPRITWIHVSGGSTRVRGRLESRPNTTFRLEFYTNDEADSTGFGEAQIFQKSVDVTTDSAGVAMFDELITGSFGRVVGTATDPEYGTSEVSKAPFIVNSTADRPDADPNDGLASTSGPPVNGMPEVTLRSALQASNHVLGEDDIGFDIPGGGAQFIAPGSPLPVAQGNVTIDGTTQPGFVAGEVPVIRVQGGSAGPFSHGLTFWGDRATVRGLYLASFTGDGIHMTGRILTLAEVTSNANRRSGIRAENHVLLEGPIIVSGNGPSTDRTATVCDDRTVAGLWLGGWLQGRGDITAAQNCGNGVHHDGGGILEESGIDLLGSLEALNNAVDGLRAGGPVRLRGEHFAFSGNGSQRTDGTGVWMSRSSDHLTIEATAGGPLPNLVVENNSSHGIYTMGGDINLRGRARVAGNGVMRHRLVRFNSEISGLYTNGRGTIRTEDLHVENNGYRGIKAGGSLYVDGNLTVRRHVSAGVWAIKNVDLRGTQHLFEENEDQALWAANGWLQVRGQLTVRNNTIGGNDAFEGSSDGDAIVGAIMAEKSIDLEDVLLEQNEPSGITSRDNILIRGNAVVRNSRDRGIFAYDRVTILGASHEISGSGGDGIVCNNGPLTVRGALTLRSNGRRAGMDDGDAGDGLFGPVVDLENVTSEGNARNGLAAHGGGIVIRGRALIRNNALHGVWTTGPARLSGGRISGNGGYGISASSVRLSGTQVSDNGEGGVAGRIIASSAGERVLFRNASGLPAFPVSVIRGSSVTGNGGPGIEAAGPRLFTVEGSNISGNTGPGVSATGGASVLADNNWWGSPAGPAGSVSGSVAAATWLSSAVGLYAGAGADSIFVRPGDSLTVSAVVANWSAPDDSFSVSASDQAGWLATVTSHVVVTRDSTPSVVALTLMVPSGTAPGDTSIAVLSASSMTSPASTADTFTVVVYTPSLRHVALLSDTSRIFPRDTVQLSAVGLDQTGREWPFVPQWTASGGSVDSSGRFVAGDSLGIFRVIVADTTSGYKDSTVVIIVPRAPTAPAGTLSLSTAQLNLGSAAPGDTVQISMVATNVAGDVLSIDSVRTLTRWFSAAREPDVARLRAGDTLAIVVAFMPDSLRAYVDTLLVHHSDSPTSPRRIPLSGNGSTTGVAQNAGVPTTFELAQNYPNPFNPSTTIRFSLPAGSHVRLTVHDILGREIARLEEGIRMAGHHRTVWSPRVASGVYFVRLEARGLGGSGVRFVDVKRMILMK